jgi:hypothetical protein
MLEGRKMIFELCLFLIILKRKTAKKKIVLVPNGALVTTRNSFFEVAGIPAFLGWGDAATEEARVQVRVPAVLCNSFESLALGNPTKFSVDFVDRGKRGIFHFLLSTRTSIWNLFTNTIHDVALFQNCSVPLHLQQEADSLKGTPQWSQNRLKVDCTRLALH